MTRGILNLMRKSTSGFTIVELLIVIVVIVILVSIMAVAYNGAQQRARTAQTTSAADQWLKGLMMYKARNGMLPQNSSCLGAGYLYDVAGTASSGTAQCGIFGGVNYLTNTTFATAMNKYMSGLPTPAMVTAANNSTSWYRGITYAVNTTTNTAAIYFALDAGQTCPLKIGETPRVYAGPTSGINQNMVCMYDLGSSNSS